MILIESLRQQLADSEASRKELEKELAIAAINVQERDEFLIQLSECQQSRKELVEELKFWLACLDEGSLVRNISKDSDPNWHLKMVILITHIQKSQALANAKGEE